MFFFILFLLILIEYEWFRFPVHPGRMTPQNFRCISICPLIFNLSLESRLKFLPSKNLKIIISPIFLLPFYQLKRGVRICFRILKALSSFWYKTGTEKSLPDFYFQSSFSLSISASWTSWMQHYVLIGAWWILADCTLNLLHAKFNRSATGFFHHILAI